MNSPLRRSRPSLGDARPRRTSRTSRRSSRKVWVEEPSLGAAPAKSPGSRYPVPRRSRGFPPASGGLLGLTRRRRRMGLTKEVKEGIVQKHGASKTDTGSTKVQVALLTQRINDLTDHLRTHTMYNYSRRILLNLVGR